MSELTTTVGVLLQQKPAQIWSIEPGASVYRAIEMMADRQVGALLVIEKGVLKGIVSERDYARKVILKGRSSKDMTVAEIMTSPVIFVSRDHSVEDCMRIITKNRIRHLPVLKEGEVTGMISIGDLVNWVITEQEHTIRHLEAYISGSVT